MKAHTLLILLAALILAWPAHAAPMLVVDAILTEEQADGSKVVWHADPRTVGSGMMAVMKVGLHEWTVTPTLKDGGVVVAAMKLTRREGGKEVVEARPQIAVKLGQAAEMQVGSLKFTITVTLPE